MDIKEIQDRIVQTNKDNGWYEGGRSAEVDLLLVHSEVSEACEELRAGHAPDHTYYRTPDGSTTELSHSNQVEAIGPGIRGVHVVTRPNKPEGVPAELADVLIRVLDMAYRHGIDIEAAVIGKDAYNQTRGKRHGGKSF